MDHIEYGNCVSRVATMPLATKGPKGKPVLTTSDWPIMVKDQSWQDIASANFLVSVAKREEKGTDVNVASHLLIDVLNASINAAVVITNDSDLRLPIEHAREGVPVGTINPTKKYTAGALLGSSVAGAGMHWWHQLSLSDFQECQLVNPVENIRAPSGW